MYMFRHVSICISLLLTLSCGTDICAQQLLSRAELDSLMVTRVADGAEAVFRYDSLQHDMGVVYADEAPRNVGFTFTNVSGSPVRITRVTTNCGCTAPQLSDSLLNPGENACLNVAYNPRGRSGTVDTDIFVYTSLSDREPFARFTLLGNVVDNDEWSHLPFAMGKLKVKRKEVSFEPLKAGTAPQQRIPCANVGTTPIVLSSRVLPSYVRFATEPCEIAPGEEGDIVITIMSDSLPENYPSRFKVIVEGVDGRIHDRTIDVTIEK